MTIHTIPNGKREEKCKGCRYGCEDCMKNRKPDSRREEWGHFTISPQDCGSDFAPEIKSVDQIISLLGSTAKDTLMPDAYRKASKQFIPVFHDFKSQLTSIRARNKELEKEVERCQRLTGENSIAKKELMKQNAELVSKVKVAEDGIEQIEDFTKEEGGEAHTIATQLLKSLRSPSSK